MSIALDFITNEPLPYSSPANHHYMSESEHFHRDITEFVTSHPHDVAVKVFTIQLEHIFRTLTTLY